MHGIRSLVVGRGEIGMTEAIFKEVGRIVVRELLAPLIKTLWEEFRQEGYTGDSFKAWERWLKSKGIDVEKTLPPGMQRILDEIAHTMDDLGGGRA